MTGVKLNELAQIAMKSPFPRNLQGNLGPGTLPGVPYGQERRGKQAAHRGTCVWDPRLLRSICLTIPKERKIVSWIGLTLRHLEVNLNPQCSAC
jgi:hypothetical protein